jgi:biotin carboxylase
MSQHVLFVNLRRIPREGFESLLAAHRLDYGVVMLARDVPEWARALVDEVVLVDTFELEPSVDAARGLARRYSIHGVPCWTEVDVEVAAHVAEALGLPGLEPETARRARNKFVMKQALAHLDGLLPRFARVTDLEELERAVAEVGLPAVVKPTGASGSKGIFELHSPNDLTPALARLHEIATPQFDPVFRQFPSEFIVEEYLDGVEVSVEGFVAFGRVRLAGITDKVTTEPFHLELRHVFPSALDHETQQGIEAVTSRIVRTLGIDQCSFHLEGKLTTRGFRFIEVAARPAGDYIVSHVVPLASGIQFFENVIRVACGLELELEPTRQFVAGVRFLLSDRAGRFERLDGVETLLERPGYEHVFAELPPGATVRLPPEHFTSQRVAAVLGRHVEHARLLELLEDAAKHVRPVVAPGGTG